MARKGGKRSGRRAGPSAASRPSPAARSPKPPSSGRTGRRSSPPKSNATDHPAPGTLPLSDYRHKTSTRKNNPPAKIAAEGTVPVVPRAKYTYSPHLAPILRYDHARLGETLPLPDRILNLLESARHRLLTESETRLIADALAHHQPWLEWATKREQHDHGYFEVDPVALHIHERVSAQAILKAAAREDIERGLFADPEQEYHEAVQFYRHNIDWTNRLILGDSLTVMSSLAHREDLAGKVQMIYLDPPYGIKFASNFQPEVGRRDVKDKDTDLTREPEMVKAYQDTWNLGVHSYLSYLRDRLRVAKELLTDTGSIFVQISDENLHRVRMLMDEVFGAGSFIALIGFAKTSGATSDFVPSTTDYLVWYARNRGSIKYRPVHDPKIAADEVRGPYSWLEEPTGERRRLDSGERHGEPVSADQLFRLDNLQSQSIGRQKGLGAACWFPVSWDGTHWLPGEQSRWKTNEAGMKRLRSSERLAATGGLYYVRFFRDFPVKTISNSWGDTSIAGFASSKVYVVETSTKVIERCLLLTTDPGDLVLDPTCGSGTTAYVAEQWGRRWITIDTSRVAIAIARQRLLTAKFDYHQLRPINDEDQQRNPNGPWLTNGADHLQGPCTFMCETVPHVTLKSIAQNTNLDPIFAKHESILAARLKACNEALAKVTVTQREAFALKLARKIVAEGWRAPSDADYRRWLLPGTTRAMIESALVTAYAGTRKNPTAKQVAALVERIPTRAEVGESSVSRNGIGWEHWQMPFDTDPDWPAPLAKAVTDYRAAWRAKMDEVNASIAANAGQEELVDQPEVVKGITRVSGPFTVEAVQPPPMSMSDIVARTDDPEFAGAPEQLETFHEGGEPVRAMRFIETRDETEVRNAAAYLKQMFDLIRLDGVRLLNNKQMAWSRIDAVYESGRTDAIHAEGRWHLVGEADGDPNGPANVAVAFGPQYGPVAAAMVEQLMRDSARAGYEHLVIAGFAFDGNTTAVISEAGADKGMRVAGGGRMFVHLSLIAPSVNPAMNNLLKEPAKAGSGQLFTVFGLPRVRVDGPGAKGSMGNLKTGEPPEGEFTVAMEGVDIYDPVTNEVLATDADKVAAWFLDSDYDGRTFCITQAFFPDRSAWEKLSRALNGPGGPIDAERFEAFLGTTSLPFPRGKHATVAVKVIDPRGNEVMRVATL